MLKESKARKFDLKACSVCFSFYNNIKGNYINEETFIYRI